MRESLDVSAQLTQVTEVDITRVAKLRQQARDQFQKREAPSSRSCPSSPRPWPAGLEVTRCSTPHSRKTPRRSSERLRGHRDRGGHPPRAAGAGREERR
ncbi:hypothetical protein QJS66_05085 [Kocuria rhizophila]|nr:hypothetical protein QJS66_05085 [Kocuria rhizophila]